MTTRGRPVHTSANSRLTVVVAGMIAGVPGQGGAAWAILQYVLGLLRLGHDAYLVEPVDDLDPTRTSYFGAVLRAFGLGGRAALVDERNRRCAGMSYEEVAAILRGADLLLNVAGMLRSEELVACADCRVYLDLDPAFTQLWYQQGVDVGLEGHDQFVTVGHGLGSRACQVPTCGRTWLATVPPVVLDRWLPVDETTGAAWTTVANWRSYGSIVADGVHYGQKAHSFRDLMPLARCMGDPPVVALAIDPTERRDLTAFRRHGWTLVEPSRVACTPQRYRDFIRTSRGELCVAKSGYVVSRSGWFSDRSTCYLAAGRPVVAQNTGFSDYLPVGEGLLAFDDVDGACGAIAEVESAYDRHCAAARALAGDLFDSDRVLTDLLDHLAAGRG